MRHRKIKGRLNRRSSWRQSTLRSLTRALFKHQRIRTTLAKAKALRRFAEPLITIAKNEPDALSSRRRVYQALADREAVQILFRDLAPLYREVPGGYTRIMRLDKRSGDGAEMALIELTKRTIPDEDLLGPGAKKTDKKRPKRKEKPTEKPHAAPDVDEADIQARAEKKKKQRMRSEQKRAQEKDKGKGFFGKFRRGDR